MKRTVWLLICVVMLVAVSGCDASSLPHKELSTPTSPTESKPLATFEIRDEDGTVLLDGGDLQSAGPSWSPSADGEYIPVVTVSFNQSGAQAFAEATENNIGRTLEMYVDDELITAPIVHETITGGAAIISGHFDTLEEAKELADRINSAILYEDTK